MQPIRIKVCQESDLRMLGTLARNIQRVLPVTQADIDAAAALGKGWVVKRVYEVSDPLNNLRGGTQLVIKQNSVLPGQNVQRVLIVANPEQQTVIVGPGIPPLLLPNAIANELLYVKAFGGTEQGGVPSGYTAVEYVENAASTMVKTAIHIGNDDNFKIDITATAVTGSFYLFQARDKVNASLGNANIIGISGATSGNTLLASPGIDGVTVSNGLTRVNRTGHKMRFVYDCADGNITWYVKDLDGNVENTTTGTYDPTQLNRATTNMCIYGNEAPAGSGAGQTVNRLAAGCKVYGAKLWKNGILVLDYVPAIRNSDSAVGFYDRISDTFVIAADGSLTAGNSLAPTPSDPLDIYCNNGKIIVLDHTNWNVITNPTSQTGQGMFISTDGKLQKANDRGAGVFIPVTVGKKYTVLINKKTVDIGTIIRYGQSNNGSVPNSAEQLLDWYRGTLTDGMMISFTAKRPYFVMQLSANLVEATGGVDNSIEVIEASGDYTFLKYITTTGTQYIETDISGAARWVGAGQGTSQSSGSKVIVSAQATADGTIKGAVVWLGSRLGNADTGKFWTLGGASSNMSTSTVPTLDYAEYDVTFGDNTFTGTINNFTFNTINNQWDIGVWRIGTSFAQNTGGPNYYFIGNIYRQKAYQNDVLVGDFIPAIRNSDSAVGMLDIVSGTFYENAGTGTFGAGNIIGSGETISIDPKGTLATANNLFAINTYKDVQEIITGATTHKVNVYVLNGKETAWNDTVSSSSYAMPKTAIKSDSNVLPNKSTDVICSHYSVATTESGSGVQDIIWVGGSNVNFKTKSTYPTLQDWKDFLAAQYAAGTPVILVVPLATEYEEVGPVAQTMNVVAGDNTLDIVQAGLPNLLVEAEYTKGN